MLSRIPTIIWLKDILLFITFTEIPMQIIISVDLVVPTRPSSCSFSINIQLSLPEFLVVRLTEFLVVRLSSLWRLQFICPFSYYNNTNDFVTDFATECVCIYIYICMYLATIYTYILYYIYIYALCM